MESYRTLSKTERERENQHFIDFKQMMKFKTVKKFSKHYRTRGTLGRGQFGMVMLGYHTGTEVPCAIKMIKKEEIARHEILKQLNKQELEILEETPHPHITRIFELMEDATYYYIIAELMIGGDLYGQVKTLNGLSEEQAAHITRQVLLALNFMHLKNIMHRDLKPENILCENKVRNKSEKIYVKLTDFGFATKHDPNGPKESFALGTPLYMAPELHKRSEYDNKVDVWSTGILAYFMLLGQEPFKVVPYDAAKLSKLVINSEPDYKELPKTVSADAVDFIKRALTKDPSARPTAAELLSSNWLKSLEHQLDEQVEREHTQNMMSFAQTTNFQSLVCSVMANLISESAQLAQLRETFVRWDTDQNGTLSYEELKANMQDIRKSLGYENSAVMAMMEAADSNGDGQVDYTEFITAAYNKKKLIEEASLEKAFKIFDSDGNGVITAQELKGVMGGSIVALEKGGGESMWEELLRTADADGDGTISFAEFKACMYEVVKRRAASHA